MTTELPIRSVQELDRRGLRDRVYDLILEMLLERDLDPGSRLSIDTLARHLDVSPTPVREAMVQLERTGLVTREALKGYRVAPPLGLEQLSELFEARLLLEVEATRLAAPRAADLAPGLRRAHQAHTGCADRIVLAMTREEEVPVRATQDYFYADNDFHRTIFAAAGNRYLALMHDDLGALNHRLRQAVLRGPNDVEQAVAEHEAILLAFEDGDGARAVRAMRSHIEGVRARSLADATISHRGCAPA